MPLYEHPISIYKHHMPYMYMFIPLYVHFIPFYEHPISLYKHHISYKNILFLNAFLLRFLFFTI